MDVTYNVTTTSPPYLPLITNNMTTTASGQDDAPLTTMTTTPPENNQFIIGVVLLACLLAYIIIFWCDRRRIERETIAAEAAAEPNIIVIIAEHDDVTKEEAQIRHLNRDVYMQIFEIHCNQCQISKDNFKPLQQQMTLRGDMESGTNDETTLADNSASTDIIEAMDRNATVVLAFHKDPTGNDKLCYTNTLCAICLDHYQEGETIVWSNDMDCSHVYHKECFVDYLSRRRNPNQEDNPCPTCRRNFL
jgi:Ring finger domain